MKWLLITLRPSCIRKSLRPAVNTFARRIPHLQRPYATAWRPTLIEPHTIISVPSPTSLMATLPKIPIFEAILKHDPSSVAVVHSESGRSFTYGELVKDVAAAKIKIAEAAGGKPVEGERLAFLIENGYDYVVTLLSILANHAIALPLSAGFPTHEIRYLMNNSKASMIIASEKHWEKAEDVLKEEIEHDPIIAKTDKILKGGLPNGDSAPRLENAQDPGKGGMMLYTSGTTSKPKGVILRTPTLTAQCDSLIQAWKYSPSDRLLHCLPLHHIHGTMNALLTPLTAGCTIEFLYPFNATAVWTRFGAPFLPPSDPKHKPSPITFFTVVPTIYQRLLSEFDQLPEATQAAAKEGIKSTHLRLNISGSAALPTPTRNGWTTLSSGNVLLERFGMTEVGMALSCGLAWADRVDGAVGWPLPGVAARLADVDTGEIIPEGHEADAQGAERHGEIQLRGPTIFSEYFEKPEATDKEFVTDPDGQRWFKTGDVAVRRRVDGAGDGESGGWARGPLYFIQGRKSADIIKTGGEKVSALEVEREMLALDEVSEVAVVGLPSEKWGQKVAAAVVLTDKGRTAGRDGRHWSPLDMRRAMKERLVAYKVPTEMKVIDSIPRNAMGKVNKKELVGHVWPDGT